MAQGVATTTGGERYTHVAILLHWAIAAFIIFNLVTGLFMEQLKPPLRGLVVTSHVSSGMAVLAFTVARVLWRLTHEPPPYPASMKPWERHTAHLAHFLLYSAMVLMPLTGWALVSAHPPAGSPGAAEAARLHPRPAPPAGAPAKPAPTAEKHYIWFVIPMPVIAPVQEIGREAGGVKPQEVLHEDLVDWHTTGGYLLIALLLLHIAAALKHQFFDKEAEFARMGMGRLPPAPADGARVGSR